MYAFKNGQTSVVLRVKLIDSASTSGAGKTGLAFNTAGLIISTIADNEASATNYTVTGSTIETISALGTYAAPTATKCRFKEVDATNHPGIYEIQIADARFAVSNAKSLVVSWSGASGLKADSLHIPLQVIDPYSILALFQTALPESYAADGAAGTVAQLLYLIQQALMEMSYSGTTGTIKKLDGSTTAATATINSATLPTSITRAS